eukprot:m.210574 g.210574  ORF g.210574 m.210574 type:complete len:121 (+) comp39745_c0_seq109:330-692(+)
MGKKLQSTGTMLLVKEDKERIESGDGAKASPPPNPVKVKGLVEILRYKGPKKDTFYLFCSSLKEIGREWIVRKLHGQDKSRRRKDDAIPGNPGRVIDGKAISFFSCCIAYTQWPSTVQYR